MLFWKLQIVDSELDIMGAMRPVQIAHDLAVVRIAHRRIVGSQSKLRVAGDAERGHAPRDAVVAGGMPYSSLRFAIAATAGFLARELIVAPR